MAAAPRRTSTFGEAGPLGADKSPDPTVPQPDGLDGGGEEGEELFGEVCSKDFLGFGFGGRSYGDQLLDAVKKTKQHCAVRVRVRSLAPSGVAVVWVQHDFASSAGASAAPASEGTLSLMQMAKVSVAVATHRRSGLPFVSVLEDPTYGGVSASYAMQADVKVAVAGARIGFAGPGVILNTMFDADEARYDAACPPEFQSAEYCLRQGAVDVVAADAAGVAKTVHDVAACLAARGAAAAPAPPPAPPSAADLAATPDYTASPATAASAGTRASRGLATFRGGPPVVVLGCRKGHSAAELAAHNYGMPSPAGYRTALKLFRLAERFGLPVVTFVDTCGAWPSFEAEGAGQSEAIATNLTAMAGLAVPIITVVLGEGGSGGALGIAMGNRVAMLSQAYYGVISPEGAASILGRYADDDDKKARFPADCQALAEAQGIYAHQLEKLGVVDAVLVEAVGETAARCPETAARVGAFVATALGELGALDAAQLVVGGGRGSGPRRKRRFDGPAAPAVEPPKAVENAKTVLDRSGPEAMAAWVRSQSRVLMLIRGANAVGYTSYPDNVVTEFVRLAALNGMDVFRIFDCFNDVGQMRTCVDAVRAAGKVAEVCVCYTSDCLASDVYDVAYYAGVAAEAAAAGAHLIGIKDMAGLLKPAAAAPLLAAIRGVCDLPVHFHTHCTSSASPSLNAFCAAMEGLERAPGIDYMRLEPYDVYWAKCQSMGLADRWEEVLDAYRDVNKLFGDVVKVTPSSKCVGDLALYLVTRKMTAADVLDGSKALDYPDSVFDDFMRFCVDETCVSVYLPTPVYLHGLAVGQTARLASLPAPLAKLECGVDAVDAVVDVDVTLKRVGPLKAGRMRTPVFDVNGAEQRVEVKNPAPEGEFDGPMADAGDAAHVAAPMPGAVDKVATGRRAAAGDDPASSAP
ncbi:pyruvate carboxylase [Aureococcus anophagefferens]|nr:pyruvate carboxylase [Aureococcus anophagefferens]